MPEFDGDPSLPNTRSTWGRQVTLNFPNEGVNELNDLLDDWEENSLSADYSAVDQLEKMCVLMEKATHHFLQLNPDPLDDRHPSKTHPLCSLGQMIRAIVRKDDFLSRLVNSYIMARDNVALKEVALRLLLSCVPGIDPSSAFSEPEEFIPYLYDLALRCESSRIVQAYSIGLLACVMEVSENAGRYRPQNIALIPTALNRLKELRVLDERENACSSSVSNVTSESGGGSGESSGGGSSEGVMVVEGGNGGMIVLGPLPPENALRRKRAVDDGCSAPEEPPAKRKKSAPLRPMSPPRDTSPCRSNSQWNIVKQVIIGRHQIYPLSHKMHQRLILSFLASIGEYQDLLIYAYEGNALSFVCDYIQLEVSADIRLTLDALKYTCALLVHRKFALEFVARGGVQLLLKVPRGSLAAPVVTTCFYYMSYAEDVMEKVCQLPADVLDQLVEYILWEQEHSHESGMGAATMFFSYAFAFREILDRFDERDGLRKLYNYISTLTILQESSSDADLTEDQVGTSILTMKNAASAIKSYVTVHLMQRVEQLPRVLPSAKTSTPLSKKPLPAVGASGGSGVPRWKAVHQEEQTLKQAMWTMASAYQRNVNLPWKAIEDVRRLGIIKLLLTMLVQEKEWNPSGQHRSELTIRALHALTVAATVPKVQRSLCEETVGENNENGICMLMNMCDDEEVEADVQIAALNALIICVCPPVDVDKKKMLLDKIRQRPNAALELREMVWATIRQNNGIMLFNRLIRISRPVTSADEIRALTCTLLCGLARDAEVKQILLKIPLIAANELHDLMKQPVCPEKKSEHSTFCQEAKTLISILLDKSLKSLKKDFTQEKLWQQHVVSSTRISYNDKELLQLIHSHLLSKGYTKAADVLSAEADLSAVESGTTGVATAPSAAVRPTPKSITALPSRNVLVGMNVNGWKSASPTPPPLTPFTPIAHYRKNKVLTPFPRRLQLRPTPGRARGAAGEGGPKEGRPAATMELNDIVTEYLRVQHSNCSKPVSTCPPFSLFHPHRCPESTTSTRAPLNMATRLFTKQTMHNNDREQIFRMDEQFVFSRFRRMDRVFQEHDEMYTACAFSIDDEHLIVGLYSGEIHYMNIETGVDEAMYRCHHSAISLIQPSTDGSMLLTSGLYMPPMSTLWRLGDTQEHLMDFPTDRSVTFNNASVQDRVIGTTLYTATVYDIETGTTLSVLNSPSNIGAYSYNKATFSPCDRLILHDNLLFDIRSPDPLIRTFDRLNEYTGGVFHPHGNEVIINSEVWDLRSYHLLHSVPVLDQCMIQFNSTGNVLLAAQRCRTHDPHADPFKRPTYASTFRSVSSIDYKVISTMDTRRSFFHIALDHADKRLAIVELLRSYNNEEDYVSRPDETACRMYHVGAAREWDDESQDEDDMDDDMGEDEGTSDDEDSDDSGSDDDLDSVDSADSDGYMQHEHPLDALDRFENGSEEEEEEEEEEENGEEEDSEGSSGWETASDQEGGDVQEENEEGEEEEEEDEGEDEEEEDANFMDDGSDEEDDREDPAYNPDTDDRSGNTLIVLNPHLRKRREDGGSGGGGGSSTR